jgi:hypothetical protein
MFPGRLRVSGDGFLLHAPERTLVATYHGVSLAGEVTQSMHVTAGQYIGRVRATPGRPGGLTLAIDGLDTTSHGTVVDYLACGQDPLTGPARVPSLPAREAAAPVPLHQDGPKVAEPPKAKRQADANQADSDESDSDLRAVRSEDEVGGDALSGAGTDDLDRLSAPPPAPDLADPPSDRTVPGSEQIGNHDGIDAESDSGSEIGTGSPEDKDDDSPDEGAAHRLAAKRERRPRRRRRSN